MFGGLGARRAQRPPPLKERFAHFLAVCSSNDRFLGRLSQMMELSVGSRAVAMATVHTSYEALCDSLEEMVSSLVSMAPGRYPDLPGRLVGLEQEVGRAVLKTRPIETLPFVVWPEDAPSERADLVGGKAAKLSAVARQLDLRIPGFFVVTDHAFHHLLDATGVQDQVAELLEGNESSTPEHVRHACEEIRRAILAAEVPEELAQSIREAYGKLRASQRSDFGVAVRSSALVEDSEFSFAGQFETVLGVREEGLLDAYKQVVASKYRHEAVQYARMSGFLDEEVAMPVLFMRMVQPSASGVVYSRDPEGADAVIVSAVRGLAEAAVGGRVAPDRYVVSRTYPHPIIDRSIALKQTVLRCSEKGGVLEVPVILKGQREAAIRPDTVAQVAGLALRLEEHFGRPQDVEWAMDDGGALYVVQSRPLREAATEAAQRSQLPPVEGHRVLLSGAQRACGGVASGPVARVFDLETLDAVKEGVVLVVPMTSPRLSSVVGRVAAIVADTGSPTGHMATVAREFHVPTIVNAEGSTALLADGQVVTLDAWTGRIYEGEVPELLETERAAPLDTAKRDAAQDCLKRLLDRVSPLYLEDPRSPSFTVESCRTLHDVARFVHQKSMAEMFSMEGLSPRERREARRLRWSVPMEILVLDLGGGVAEGAMQVIDQQAITSLPFLALIEGMTDPRVRWAGPVGFDLKGFMSVVVRSAADDQRYGEPSYAVCSGDYVHFSSRLAYHFATTDAMCSSSENRNYARFVFFGGAAVAARREWRAHFLATVLKCNRFEVTRVQDRVEALLGKRSAGDIEESLVLLGRLMAATRHLDMVMDSQSTAEAYAAAFLAGDFGFEFVRRGLI
jgi:pyruvate,water dikinase